jgi:acetoin utilization protein AcuB
MQIQELNYAGLPWIQQTDTVAAALQQMEDEQVTQLPVVEDTVYVGMLSMNILLEADDDTQSIQQVSGLLPRPAIHAEDHVLTALQLAAEHSLTVIPITTAANELVGAIEQSELIRFTAGFLGLAEGGALLVVEKEQQQYAASEVVKLVETNDAQVLQLNTQVIPHAGLIRITLRLNKSEIAAIISTFQRYDYTVRFFIGEEQYANELRANYDNLIHYLKV